MPTNLNLKEELKILAAMKKKCSLGFRSDGGSVVAISDRIIRFFEEEEASYLQLESGLMIPLQNLVTLDGRPVEHWA